MLFSLRWGFLVVALIANGQCSLVVTFSRLGGWGGFLGRYSLPDSPAYAGFLVSIAV
ncbi:hypothetical protein M3906_000246 [Vibrio metschnikovii]|nr:hypothetical protein [Vibrio metschnikovii]